MLDRKSENNELAGLYGAYGYTILFDSHSIYCLVFNQLSPHSKGKK